MKTSSIIILCILAFTFHLNAQVYNKPIAGKQSHPELEITKIEINQTETVVSLKITNKLSNGGWFCADKNIYIKDTKGTKTLNLIKSENIPTCPDQFEFSYSGQTLEFKLFFPPIPKEIRFIDLIEDCNNECFSFNGIILDNLHNENIRTFETGFDMYQNKNLEEAISHFEKVASNKSTVESHIYGLSYYYLILIYHDQGNYDQQNKFLNLLLDSEIEDKETFIKELEKSGIKK